MRKSYITTLGLVTFSIFFLNFSLSAEAIPFNPIPNPPYENIRWGVQRGYIGTWNHSIYNSTGWVHHSYRSYNITGTSTFSWNGTIWYILNGDSGTYYPENNTFIVSTPNDRLSFINLTQEYIYMASYFIPLNGTEMMLDWCANAILNYQTFINYWFNNCTNIEYSVQYSPNNNLIHYIRTTSNEYLKLIYDDYGVLKYLEVYTWFNDVVGFILQKLERIYPITSTNPAPTIPFWPYTWIITFLSISIGALFIKQKLKYIS